MQQSNTFLSTPARLSAITGLLVLGAANAQFVVNEEEQRERPQYEHHGQLNANSLQQPALSNPHMREGVGVRDRALLNADRDVLQRGNAGAGSPGKNGMTNPNGNGIPSMGAFGTGQLPNGSTMPGSRAGLPGAMPSNKRLAAGLQQPGQGRFALPTGRKSIQPGKGKPPAGVQSFGKLPKGALAKPGTGLFGSDIGPAGESPEAGVALSGFGGGQVMAGGKKPAKKPAKQTAKTNAKNKSADNSKDDDMPKILPMAKLPETRKELAKEYMRLSDLIDSGKATKLDRENQAFIFKMYKKKVKEDEQKKNRKKMGNCHASDPNCDMSTEEQRSAKLRKGLMKDGKFPGEGDRMRPVNEDDGNDDSYSFSLGSSGYSRPTQSSTDGQHAGGRIISRLEMEGNPGGERD